MVRFIHTTPDKSGPRRRQARQACPACRRRKKRCTHVGAECPRAVRSTGEGALGERIADPACRYDEREANRAPELHVPSPVPPSEPSDETRAPRSRSDERALDAEATDAHFVGDLNPESTFLADSHETTGRYTEADGIGVWVSRRTAARGTASRPRENVPWSAEAFAFQQRSVPEDCLTLLPADSHYSRLEEIYLRDIHKILPVIDLDVLRNGSATIPHLLTKQAVCLAAAAHPDSKPFLTLGPSATPLPYATFSTQLISAMRAVLNSGIEKDRLQLIRPLAILALNTYSSPDRHLSTELASLAVSYTQTVGLHHRSPPASWNPECLERLFCCVWAVDRLNAAFHGRPVLMHERDFGRDLGSCLARQESCFRLFLECVVLLDGVIHLYRPTADPSGNGWELPRFEELVEKASAFDVESQLLVTIELLYHAIVILSCRAPSAARSCAQVVTPRESLSSLAITTIIAEFRDRLPRLTFVPYSASLALRTTYRELRASTVPTVRARSFKQLRAICRMLRQFEEMYRPASIMVGLVDKLTREIDRASGYPGRSGPGSGTSTPLRRDDGPRREEGVPAADGMSGGSVSGVSPALDGMPTDDLSRLDVFESLNFDFDFDALDAAFRDYTYPCAPESM